MKFWQYRGVLPMVVMGVIGLGYWFADPIETGQQTSNPTSNCEVHTTTGLPEIPVGSILVQSDIYCLSANPTTKMADWVVYRLDAETIDFDCGIEQTRDWAAAPSLDPAVTLEPEDYIGAYDALGTDRGHLAPLRSFCGSPYWQQTNYLSNVVPQRSEFNRGVWADLEKHVRELARTKTVYVRTGVAHLEPMSDLPGADEAHSVPSHFWKVVEVDDRVETYLFSQDTDVGRFEEGAIGIQELEGAIAFALSGNIRNK